MAEATQVPAQVAQQKALDAIDHDIAELHKAFEQYFLGFERLPPMKQRDDLHKRILKLKGENPRNTGIKFRLNSCLAKFLSYDRMWQRTLKEIEEGTYKRDVIRAKKRMAQETARGMNAPAAGAEKAPTLSRALEALKSLSDDKLKQLYSVYLEAKRRCNEPTEGLTFDAVASTIRKQVPDLIVKHNAKAIDFKVVIKGGKALLKAVPRE